MAFFGRIRHELNSPVLDGQFTSPPQPPALTFPKGARKWAVVGKDNWTALIYEAISELLLLSKEANRLRPAFLSVKLKLLDRPGPPRSMSESKSRIVSKDIYLFP
ncbi:hypothetical protein AVEN_62484-1 [Araneus ventricosus]|uniref:Uncharacterized protein n=1 Tax=Araneus ventricosus TaxID=182803 RepID=A0A4Y2LAI7_ARAVE|nr:hypothetical protein AVEN_62484-1 [Araneus ventricosus]